MIFNLKNKSRRRAKIIALLVSALLVCFAVINRVNAQVSSPPNENDFNVKIEKADEGNIIDRIAWLQEQMENAKGIYRQVQNMLDRARQEKDSVKIDCLDDKLTQIHVNLRGIEERTGALQIATAAKDNSTADQQFIILKIYVARINGLMAEADGCIGDTDVVIGQSDTLVTIDEDITLEDPTDMEDVQTEIEPPPHASGFF